MCSEIKNEGNRMLLVKCFNDHSPLADSTETISRFDRVACFFVVISHRKYTKWFYFFLNDIKFSLQTYFNIKLKYVSLFEQNNNTTKCLKGMITKLTISGNWFAKKKFQNFYM